MRQSAGVRLPGEQACLLTGTVNHSEQALPPLPRRLRDAEPLSISHMLKGCAQCGAHLLEKKHNSRQNLLTRKKLATGAELLVSFHS